MNRKEVTVQLRIALLISVFLLVGCFYLQPAFGLSIPGSVTMPSLTKDISGDFTDPKFKQAVWSWLGNSGTPGVITKANIVNRMSAEDFKLVVSNKNIESLAGIEHFEGLKYLFCDNNQLSSLPSLPSTLKSLFCWRNKLTSLPVLPNSLTDLNCDNNQLSTLPSLPSTLTYLYCYGNKLTSLPALPDTLKTLGCSENQLSSLPLLPSTLTGLYCSKNKLTSLPNLPSSLEYLSCSDNQLTDLPALPNTLTKLNYEYNYLNVFSDPLKARITACPAGDKTYKPQYRLKYTGNDVQLAQKETRQLKGSELKIQMSSDNAVWGDVENADLSLLTFTSSNNNVAKVDTTGLITGQGAGTCSIYALLNGVNSDFTKSEIKVTVSDQVAVGTPGSGNVTPTPGGGSPPGTTPPQTPGGDLKILMTIGSPTAFINGTGKSMDVPPTIINSRTMVPFRFIGEAFGADVEWLGESKTVVVRHEGKEVRLVIGQTGPGLDVPAQIVNNRTMVPMRYISNALGADVQWFQETRSIEIVK